MKGTNTLNVVVERAKPKAKPKPGYISIYIVTTLSYEE